MVSFSFVFWLALSVVLVHAVSNVSTPTVTITGINIVCPDLINQASVIIYVSSCSETKSEVFPIPGEAALHTIQVRTSYSSLYWTLASTLLSSSTSMRYYSGPTYEPIIVDYDDCGDVNFGYSCGTLYLYAVPDVYTTYFIPTPVIVSQTSTVTESTTNTVTESLTMVFTESVIVSTVQSVTETFTEDVFKSVCEGTDDVFTVYTTGSVAGTSIETICSSLSQ